MNIQLPDQVKKIICTLQEHGYEAYAVGGCVRDSILGKEPEDWDITTSARPEQIKGLFRRTFDTGIKHGTITVLENQVGYEVTTYRVDGEYEDFRRPKGVTFTGELSEDLLRRDFTINAMAYNDEEGLIDPFGGAQDLSQGMIRCVGNPRDRFGEDALRMLRAIRFAAQLGFVIEADTLDGIKELSATLAHISAERIQVELVKMLVSPNPGLLRTAYETGITKIILPEFDKMMETEQETPHHQYNVGEHTLKALRFIRADKVLRLTMLLHDVAKPIMKTIDEKGIAHFKGHDIEGESLSKSILRRLKFDNDTIHKVSKLIRYHDYRMPAKMRSVRRFTNKIGLELLPLYLEIRRADTMAQSPHMRQEKLDNLNDIESCYQEILASNQCVSIKSLAVTGRDLIDAGMKPGKEIGETLNHLLELVLDDPEYNTKEQLLKEISTKTK